MRSGRYHGGTAPALAPRDGPDPARHAAGQLTDDPMTPRHDDERYWSGIRAQYALHDDFINLENGFFGMPAIPVAQAAAHHMEHANLRASHFMRNRYPAELEATVAALAALSGCAPEEVAVTRNATEGMNILLQGYPFFPEDELVYSNHEYDSVIETVEMLHARRRVKAVKIDLPLRLDSDDDILARYACAITPNTRAIVVTHLLHRTGRIMPVARIADLAKRRGIDVIVDAAHSYAQLDFRIPDLGADFLAANLHKWLGAPIGSGLLYVKRERVAEVSPLFGCTMFGEDDIRKLTRIGTIPPANVMAIRDAIDFHNAIGSAAKEARMRHLQRSWSERVRRFSHVEMLVPEQAEAACALASFRVRGRDGAGVVRELLERHRIFTAAPKVGTDTMVRVVPFLYTSPAELDRLVEAIEALG